MRQLTRRERRSVAILLRRARPFIEHGGERFICHALHVACRDRIQYNIDILWATTSMVRNRMSGYTTLEEWLHGEHAVRWVDRTDENMRAYRLAWMDALINEFEGEKK